MRETSSCLPSIDCLYPVVLQILTPDQQQQQGMEAYQKCKFSGPCSDQIDLKPWGWGPGICFITSLTVILMQLKFEKRTTANGNAFCVLHPSSQPT